MSFEIFLATSPGLENALYEEIKGKGFKHAKTVKGGVTIIGGWPEVWRANLWVRGASRVLARIATFKVTHISELEARLKDISWLSIINSESSVRVEASCSKSRIYHSGAVVERIERALAGAVKNISARDADITIMARLHHDICTLSVDTSGDLLHKRGYKTKVNKAPMRENMAALFLLQCGYKGAEPVYDPMCGSGTFVIEAAEVSARLNPGRSRTFAFEKLTTFDPETWEMMRNVKRKPQTGINCYGSDRDAGAVQMCRINAKQAGVDQIVEFEQRAISDIKPPCSTPGLVIVNPPYGERIGDKQKLVSLYQSFGAVMRSKFSGWRVGIITSDPSFSHATGLKFLPTSEPVSHGGVRVTLFQTNILP